ncbi:MAG: hypothetical protein RIT81_27785 [Deltaproteobacteria bacterium]
MNRWFTGLLTLMLTVPGVAFAEEEAPQEAFKKKTVIEFSEVRLSGELVKPSATLVRVRRKTRFVPLIRVRGDFRPELLASTDAL